MQRTIASPPPKALHEYFSTEPHINRLDWQERFSLASIDKHYVAQGMALHDATAYHTIHKKDRKSVLIIFDKEHPILRVVKQIDLPREATHTSDLTIYEGHFYAIDYHSNFIYQFDFKELHHKLDLRLTKKVRVTKNNRQFGSLEVVRHGDAEYLFVTSFANDDRMYVFDFDKFFRKSLGFEASLLFSVRASYFTQGLSLSGDRKALYHSVNRFGVDFIYEINLETLLRTKDYRRAILRSFLAPNKMVEDLAVQEGHVYTSDEYTNKLYSAALSSAAEAVDYRFNDVSRVPYHEKLMSHRARVWNFEENTLDAFVEVLATNVKYVEIDVRFSSDDIPFVYHDSFFAEGKERFRFSEKTWAEIEQYRYQHNHLRISRFEEVLAHFAKHRTEEQILAIDIKDAGVEKHILDMIEAYGVGKNIIMFTWTPQIIFRFDELFRERGVSIPLFFSHVRVDSLFKYLLVPSLLNYRRFFLGFKDFILIGNSNYREPLGAYERGHRHVPYFARLPADLITVLKRHEGGVCVTKKAYRWGDRLLRDYKAEGLKVAVFGAFFGIARIDTKAKFEYEAKKEFVDIVFVDDLSQMASAAW